MGAQRQVDASIAGNWDVGAGAMVYSRRCKNNAEHDYLLKSEQEEVGSHGALKDGCVVGC